MTILKCLGDHAKELGLSNIGHEGSWQIDPILGCPGFYWVSEPHPWWSPIIWDFGCVFLILSVSMDDNDSITFIRREMYQSAKKNTALSHSHCFHLSLVPGVGFSIDSLINQSKYRTKDGLNPF